MQATDRRNPSMGASEGGRAGRLPSDTSLTNAEAYATLQQVQVLACKQGRCTNRMQFEHANSQALVGSMAYLDGKISHSRCKSRHFIHEVLQLQLQHQLVHRAAAAWQRIMWRHMCRCVRQRTGTWYTGSISRLTTDMPLRSDSCCWQYSKILGLTVRYSRYFWFTSLAAT